MRGLPQFDLVEFASYHEGRSGELVTNRFDASWRDVIPLQPAEHRLKRLMLACFGTQARVLAPFTTAYESLRVAPASDFTQPPPAGRVWFERFAWGVTGTSWRAIVAGAARRLAVG